MAFTSTPAFTSILMMTLFVLWAQMCSVMAAVGYDADVRAILHQQRYNVPYTALASEMQGGEIRGVPFVYINLVYG